MNYLDLAYSPVKDFILMGSGFKGSKKRILNFFSESHTNKEKVAFLKNEYGTGGFITNTKTPCSICGANWNVTGIKLAFYYPNGIKGTCTVGYEMLAAIIGDMLAEGIYMKAKNLLSLSDILERERKEKEKQPIKKDLWAIKKALAPVFDKEQLKGQIHILDYVEFG